MFEGEYEKVKKLRTWKNISPNTWEKVPFEAEVIFANFPKERKCVSNVMERKKCLKKRQSSAPHQTKGLTLVEAGGGLEILLRSVRYNFWSQKVTTWGRLLEKITTFSGYFM